MFHQQQKPEPQKEIDAATLRTLVDLNLVCDPESVAMTVRRPFRIQTREGLWTGAFLPDMMGAVAVQCELRGDVISTNSRIGRDLSWSLRQTAIYARTGANLNEFYESLRDEDNFSHNGWTYQATPILKLVRALGAPDSRFEIGHFTYQEPLCGVENPQVLALSGTVAHTQWRAFVLPAVDRLKFADGGHIQ